MNRLWATYTSGPMKAHSLKIREHMNGLHDCIAPFGSLRVPFKGKYFHDTVRTTQLKDGFKASKVRH